MHVGRQTWLFKNKPVIISTGTVVGPDEGEGPLADTFDYVHEDLDMQEKSWEKAERKLLEQATQAAVQKSTIQENQINYFVGGDLMNQIISNTFAARKMGLPYIGVFGACSTSMESLAIASLLVDTGNAEYVMAGTCSHNCTAEKQFRYPTEYGSQKPPYAQFTVTGAGAAIVAATGDGPRVIAATIGKIMDFGLTDPFNMGAAMAPAAVDTIQAHLADLNRTPSDYDLIVTGDLASVGLPIARDLFKENGLSLEGTVFNDCGLMVFDLETQAVQAGGSGCGCSAVVTYGHILQRMQKGELKRVMIAATGALLSPLSYQQGESIPCIAHAVTLEMEG
ncbi:MAG: stage V sporulation protein AD [Paenibacillus sp.]|uniref:Stage V sporulation protein AD n=1 Tax=Paenibacillus aquistagni TaxID=1852522 RepID=A0A1X7IC19_9BACL|nr:stage V sporulation protein AD [Paenibacillus aquistagni]MBR2568779.1 stage V sporulation protein AD [Paenibacillus sp.]SMG11698.1 stage V sporulation protein AD [Paenibacillus aquistagni]